MLAKLAVGIAGAPTGRGVWGDGCTTDTGVCGAWAAGDGLCAGGTESGRLVGAWGVGGVSGLGMEGGASGEAFGG